MEQSNRRAAMFRLADHLARSRKIYPSPLISAPRVMVIDVPEGSRGGSLPLGRYYPIIIETEAEQTELEDFIATYRSTPALHDILDARKSQLRTDHVLISRYDPPERGWPWLCVVHWQDEFARAARTNRIAMARGCYTMEVLAKQDDLDAHCSALLEELRSQYQISVRLIAADRLGAPGRA